MAVGLSVVLGATGGAGGAVVRELVRQGKPVRAVSRSGGSFGRGVEAVQGDVRHPGDAKRVCEGAEVVYNCVNVPYQNWLDVFPAAAQGSVEGAAAAGAKLVFCDNLYVYGPPDGPMTEGYLTERAERLARASGKSVSGLVADYLIQLDQQEELDEGALPPTIRSLSGILEGTEVDETEYYRHLTRKHS